MEVEENQFITVVKVPSKKPGELLPIMFQAQSQLGDSGLVTPLSYREEGNETLTRKGQIQAVARSQQVNK